jgi:hypothetical protein
VEADTKLLAPKVFVAWLCNLMYFPNCAEVKVNEDKFALAIGLQPLGAVAELPPALPSQANQL